MPDETLHLPLIHRLLERHKDSPGALLPILHQIQEELGYIPDPAIPEIAPVSYTHLTLPTKA